MPIRLAPSRSLVPLAVLCTVTLIGCSSFGPDAPNAGVVGSMERRNKLFIDLVAQLPQSPIPCGHVQAAVVDEVAARVLKGVTLQLVTSAGETTALSSSDRYVPLTPRDTGPASLRVTRGGRVIAEFDRWHSFHSRDGHNLILQITAQSLAVNVMSGPCVPGAADSTHSQGFGP